MDLWVLNRLLGHQDLRTTQQYIAIAMADCRRAHQRAHPLQNLSRAPQSDITVEEALALLDGTRRPRDRLMFRILYTSAMRANELLRFHHGDIDEEESLVFVRGGKTEQDRYVVLDPESLRRLLEYARERPAGERIFKTDRAQLHTLVQRAARGLGILQKYEALGQTVSPHTFRHACASHCYQAGMAPDMVQKLLGHEVLRNTVIYVNVRQDRLEAEYHRCGLL